MIGRLEKDRRVQALALAGTGTLALVAAGLGLAGRIGPALALLGMLLGIGVALGLLLLRRVRFAIDRLRLIHPGAVPSGGPTPVVLSPDEALRRAVPREAAQEATEVVAFDLDHNRVWWYVPGFGLGSGGHANILLTVGELERHGVRCSIVISDATEADRFESMCRIVGANYPAFLGSILQRSDVDHVAGDVLVATDWRSVRAVIEDRGARRGAYFVQDHEAEFTATGSWSSLAADTYRAGLEAITVTTGLATLLGDRYGVRATATMLPVDPDTHGLDTPGADAPSALVIRVRRADAGGLPILAVYGRQSTERRGVEILIAGLELAARRGARFLAAIIGEEVRLDGVSFPWVSVGLQPPRELAALYRTADLGIVLSLTNPSLLPSEMLACGLPVLEADTPLTRAAFGDLRGCTLVVPHPDALADALVGALADGGVASRRAAPSMFPTPRDAALPVHRALTGREPEEGRHHPDAPSVTVAIPTLDPDPEVFRRLVAALDAQRYPGRVEIRILDSGSSVPIGTWFEQCRWPVHIDTTTRTEFRHGPARNRLMAASDTDLVAILTHDAVPLGDRWLFDMVAACVRDERIGGAFCRHLAPSSAPRVAAVELLEHFDRLVEVHPAPATPHTAPIDQDHHDAQFFLSNNGSILRRRAWEQVPFRNVAFGEDQLWARDALRAGWSINYTQRAVVEHLNTLDLAEQEERAAVTAAWEMKYWSAPRTEAHIEVRAAAELARAHRIVEDYGLSDQDLAQEVAAVRARAAGWKRALIAVRAGEDWVRTL